MSETNKITGEVTISKDLVSEIQENVKNIPDLKEKIEENLDKRLTELLDIVLVGAIALGASDIHIEPEEERAKLRFRLDGILQDILFLDRKIYNGLTSRIKLLSALMLNVSDRPQDGRFSIVIEDLPIEIRSSTLPAEEGESIVLRVLNPQNLISLEELGLRKDLAKLFSKEIKKPNGMIIVTGPTGSGKTTTLYAFLKKINEPEIKIITIEDPVEYHLDGISQTQVTPEKGYDFANGLRSLMRQDPDVVLVGEIRDLETASIALQAALTGHLVFSTLHTNDAAGTIPRLQALGEKPTNIAPAINMIIAQRLVRRVCKKCVEMKKPTEEELKLIKSSLKGLPKEIEVPKITKVAKPKGCKYCNFTGYRGRIGIHEALLIDDEIEKFILTSPATTAIRDLAIKKGMTLMRQDGFLKVLDGITTIEEIERVTAE